MIYRESILSDSLRGQTHSALHGLANFVPEASLPSCSPSGEKGSVWPPDLESLLAFPSVARRTTYHASRFPPLQRGVLNKISSSGLVGGWNEVSARHCNSRYNHHRDCLNLEVCLHSALCHRLMGTVSKMPEHLDA